MKGYFKRKNEIEQFESSLQEGASTPSEQFIGKLERDLMASYDRSSNKFSIFSFMALPKINRGVLLTSLLLVVLLSAGALTAFYPEIRSEYVRRTVDSDQIFAKMARNDSQTGQDFASRLSTLMGSSGKLAESADALLTSFGFGGDGANRYNYYENSYTYGPSSTKCPAMANAAGSQIQTLGRDINYSVMDDTGFYSKTISYDTDGDLIYYSIFDNNGAISYRGGKFAVKEIYAQGPVTIMGDRGSEVVEDIPAVAEGSVSETVVDIPGDAPSGEGVDPVLPDAPDTMPIEEPIDEVPQPDYNQLYPDGKLLGIESIDGKEYYVVSWKTEGYCDIEDFEVLPLDASSSSLRAPDEAKLTKFTAKAWVSTSDSYQIARDETYLGEISEKNLIVRRDVKYESSNKTYAQVKEKFRFDYNVELKTIKYPESGTKDELEKLTNSLANLDLDLLSPVGSDWKGEHIWSQAQVELNSVPDYSKERDYYLPGVKGDKLLKEYQDLQKRSVESSGVYAVSEMSISYMNGSRSSVDQPMDERVVIDRFESGTTVEQVKQYAVPANDEYNSVESSNTTLNINSANVPAQLFSVVHKGGMAEPYAGEDSSAAELEKMAAADSYISRIYIFTYNGAIYSVSHTVTGSSDAILATPIFSSVNSKRDAAAAKALVTSIFNTMYGY